MVNDRLLKVVKLAKHGIGGEKDAALQKVKWICEKNGLDFDEVMSSDEDAAESCRYTFRVKSRAEFDVAIQVAAKFLESTKIKGGCFRGVGCLVYKATKSKHIEMIYAVEQYLAVFRKERRMIIKSLTDGFIAKHELYPPTPDNQEDCQATASDINHMANALRASELFKEDINLRKAIES